MNHDYLTRLHGWLIQPARPGDDMAHGSKKAVLPHSQPSYTRPNVTQAVPQIIAEDRRFHLREPITLTVRHNGPYCLIGYPPLAIEGYGHDHRKALESFADAFSMTWDTYATADDASLTRDARQLKRALRRLVTQVKAA